MDVQLQELIEKIKAEGIQAAEREAQRLHAEAEARSDQIVAAARKSAAQIVSEAQEQAARFEHNAREALSQAGRDLVLSLKERITAMFRALLERSSGEAYSPKALEEAVVGLVKAWAADQTADLQVLLPAEQLAGLEKALQARLAGEIKKGLDIRPLAGLQAGFRVGSKDGSVYYDFSDQGIAEILAEFLTPRLGELLLKAAEQER